MTSDRVKEQIRFNTEFIKLIVVLMIATSGGALSLIIAGPKHARDVILAAGGIIIAVVCWAITYRRYKITQDLINKL